MLLNDTAAIVVHHRRYDSVPDVVRRLISDGIPATNVVVVDNSEQPGRYDALVAELPAEVTTVMTPNAGYAAAINRGVVLLTSPGRSSVPKFILTATHEVVSAPGATALLRDALIRERSAAVAGPTLFVRTNGVPTVWSFGGRLTHLTGVPRHHGHGLPFTEAPVGTSGVTREWLDGAFLLYRGSALTTERMNESYFLYMEEVDLHLRLRRIGWNAIWVPAAVVEQSSSGVPPYYLGRNLFIFFRRNQRTSRIPLIPLLVARSVLPNVVRSRSLAPVIEATRGMAHGWKAARKTASR